jgi:HSP20 family protein
MNLPSLFQNDRNFLSPFNQLQREVDRLFDTFQDEANYPAFSRNEFSPSCDIEETEDHYLISMDMPGMKKDDIKIELRGNQLMISGERKEEKEDKSKGRYRSERSWGSFARSFSLPDDVKADDVMTDYHNGVLQVAVPKVEESKAQQIKIGESKGGFFDRFRGKEQPSLTEKKSEKDKVA